MKIIIIGGGASGLTCAINAKNESNEVTIIEKNNICGKKILVTGNGHCNYFNESLSLDSYHTTNKEILSKIINRDNWDLVIPFFKSLGIIPKNKNGYLYPLSNTAASIQNALLMKCKNLGIEIKERTTVLEISYENNHYLVKTNNENITCDKLVVSCGGASYPNLGSTGDAINLLSKYNIAKIDYMPALTGLKTDNKITSEWDKIRCDVRLTNYEDGKKIRSEVGEVQLTNYGISGICTFNLSSSIIRNLNKHKEEITIDFLPDINEDFIKFTQKRIKLMPNNNVIELYEGLINYKLLLILLKDFKKVINNTLTDNDILKIEKTLKHFRINITGYNDFSNAQVSSGGILLSEINPLSFESNKNKGLFIIGEALDVDGICGGYNLGFAWISGIICGKHLSSDCLK